MSLFRGPWLGLAGGRRLRGEINPSGSIGYASRRDPHAAIHIDPSTRRIMGHIQVYSAAYFGCSSHAFNRASSILFLHVTCKFARRVHPWKIANSQARRPAQLLPLSACARTSGTHPAPRFARLARVVTRTANREYCCGGRGRLDGIVCARAEARAAAGNHTNLIAATLCAPPLCTPHAFHRTFRDSGTPQACRSCARSCAPMPF